MKSLIAFTAILLILSGCKRPGCTDPAALNFDERAKTEDGTCEHVLGCQDPEASNYNAYATKEDGSCEYTGQALFYTDWEKTTFFVTYDDYRHGPNEKHYPEPMKPQSCDEYGNIILDLPEGVTKVAIDVYRSPLGYIGKYIEYVDVTRNQCHYFLVYY